MNKQHLRTTNYRLPTTDYAGITIIEVLVSIGIFAMLSVGATWILISAFRNNAIVWEQLTTQSDGRKVLREVTDVVRRAEESSVGSYPIEVATTSTLVVYANIDSDSFRERVRFFLDDAMNRFIMGVIKPSGNPLRYQLANETTSTLAYDVVSGDHGVPIFLYYDESYTGTEPPLVQPVTSTAIRMVRIQLELEADPTATPVPLHVESLVHIRNLKSN